MLGNSRRRRPDATPLDRETSSRMSTHDATRLLYHQRVGVPPLAYSWFSAEVMLRLQVAAAAGHSGPSLICSIRGDFDLRHDDLEDVTVRALGPVHGRGRVRQRDVEHRTPVGREGAEVTRRAISILEEGGPCLNRVILNS